MTPRPLFVTLLVTGSVVFAQAAPVDPDHPSAIGRADDILVEARLTDDAIASGEAIGVTYDVHNLTERPIAIAAKLCSASYDGGSRTVTLSIGSEVPGSASLRRLVIVPSGAKKTFTTGAPVHLISAHMAAVATTPRYVQVRVNVLRNWTSQPAQGEDDLFEKWLESNITITLNPLPVRLRPGRPDSLSDAERR